MKHRWTNFLSILVDFRSVGKVCEPLKVLRLPAKTRVRLSALQVESRTHCNLEKVRKSGPKRRILQHFEPVGPHSAEILSNFGRNSNEGCARLIQVRAFAVGRPRAIEFRAILVEFGQSWTNIVSRTPQASYENIDIDVYMYIAPKTVNRRPRNGRCRFNRDDGRENFLAKKIRKNQLL